MAREIVSADPASLAGGRRREFGGALVILSLGAFALAFAVVDPTANVWPAAVLIAATGLDGSGRIACRVALRGRAGPRFAAVPSLVLASDRGTMVAAFLFAAAALAWPERFPVLSSLLAGLIAMGGVARFAIAWTVFRAGRDDEDE